MGLELRASEVPFISGVLDLASMGMIPAGSFANRKFSERAVAVEDGVDPLVVDLLADAQTSGGLLIVLDERSSTQMISRLHTKGIPAVDIGFAVSDDGEKMVLDAPGAHR